MFIPGGKYCQKWSGDFWILSHGHIPTTDFYLTARLRGVAEGKVRVVDVLKHRPALDRPPTGTFVVIVRTASKAWLRWLLSVSDQLSGVAYLVDDDIPGAWRCADVPLDYGFWTTGRYLYVRRLLAAVCDRVWFSTEPLRQRYPASKAQVLSPLEPYESRPPAPVGTRRWAYLGTQTHAREIRWLLPVVETVQALSADFEFEIFGGRGVEKLFAHVPRVRVLPARRWQEFVQYCRETDLAVGVTPLLAGHFNAARTWVKFLDITRCGGVGVFSQREPYWPALADAGVSFLPDDPKAWIDEVVRLLQDDNLRMQRYRHAAEWQQRFPVDQDISRLINQEGFSA